jgi:hypothetical protein
MESGRRLATAPGTVLKVERIFRQSSGAVFLSLFGVGL